MYLTLASILAAQESTLANKLVLQASAVLLVISIGVTRVYLGVHWPTDVLGGWLLGSFMALGATFILHRSSDERAHGSRVDMPVRRIGATRTERD